MKRPRAFGTPAAGKPQKRQKKAPASQKTFSKKMKAMELKSFDTALNFTYDVTTEVPATGQLALIVEGDTIANRDSQKIQVSSIQIRATLTYTPAAAAVASDVTDLYLIYDKQPNGAAATVSGDANSVFTGTISSEMLRLVANQDRFKILKHFQHTWNATAGVTTAYNRMSQSIDWYKKFDLPIHYGASAGAITDLRTGNLFLVAGTSGGSDDLVACTGNCRVRFFG